MECHQTAEKHINETVGEQFELEIVFMAAKNSPGIGAWGAARSLANSNGKITHSQRHKVP